MTFLITLTILEFLSFLFFKFYGKKFYFYDINNFTVTKKDINVIRKNFDQFLGWDKFYNTKYKERTRNIDFTFPYISTYGDSYTHCDDVNDNETWQYYLSLKLEKDVFNFGVPSYGTDQAFLKYVINKKQIKTKIAALCIVSENINRIYATYRPFYTPDSGIKLTKPHFILKEGKLILIENPLKSIDSLDLLMQNDYITFLAKNDSWLNEIDDIKIDFPYLSTFFKKNFWQNIIQNNINYQERHYISLWNNPEKNQLMFAIIDEFTAEVKNNGSTPMIILLPRKKELQNYFYKNISPDYILTLKEYCNKKNYLFFNALEYVLNNLSEEQFQAEYKSNDIGHLTPGINSMIAEGFYDFLIVNKL